MRFVKTLLNEATSDLGVFIRTVGDIACSDELKWIYKILLCVFGLFAVIFATTHYLSDTPFYVLLAVLSYASVVILVTWSCKLVARVRNRIKTENEDTISALSGNSHK
jgi:membrane protein implicated in regulation of membrane protease activity